MPYSPNCTFQPSDIARQKKIAKKQSFKRLLRSGSEDDRDNEDDDSEDDSDDLSSYSKEELVNMVRNLRRKVQKEATSHLCTGTVELLW